MKKKLLSVFMLLSTPVFTATAAINEQALQACSFIENDFNRLLCYDNTVAGKPLGKPSTTKNTLKTDTVAPKAAITKPTNEFGLEHKTIIKDNDSSINSTIKTVKAAPYGELIITLENDQQWRQIGSDRIKLEEGDKIVISRGVFNSFLLKKIDQNRSIRVKRTQ